MKTKKKRRGPEPKPPDQLRQHPITCRVTDGELHHIDEHRHQMSRGEWVRVAALARKMPKPAPQIPEANREEWAKLGKLANNLNQILRIVQKNKNYKVDPNLINELKNEVQVLRLKLIGG